MDTYSAVMLLSAAMIWGLVQMMWSAAAARAQQGLAWAIGPRDDPRPITGGAARLDRAYRNYLETFPVFVAAMLAAIVTGKVGVLTFWGGHLYIWSRIAFTPLYLLGTPYVRTIAWVVSIVGIALIIAAPLV